MSKTSATDQLSATDAAALRTALLDWFDAQKRDMPWRETQDPYAIWLSEIMLQQTRVETVRPYYAKFLQRFPTVEALAKADISEVLAAWSGLGYYRRARHLHAAAQVVMKRFDGAFPSRFEDLLSLPGVGRYTAGAIASIAFSLPHAAVDGNVYRVMSRLFDLAYAVGSRALEQQSWALASQLVQGPRPGDLNQALMELGATICTPTSPGCLLCPVRTWCLALAQGDPMKRPLPREKKPPKTLQVCWALLRRAGKILLFKRPNDGLFAGMWELPGWYQAPPRDAPLTALQQVLADVGLTASFSDTASATYVHLLTHRRLEISVYASRQPKGRIQLPRTQWRWVSPDDYDDLALSSITRRILHDFADSPPVEKHFYNKRRSRRKGPP